MGSILCIRCTHQHVVLTIHPNESKPRFEPIPTNPDHLTPEIQQIFSKIPGDGLKGKGFPHHVLGQLLHSGYVLYIYANEICNFS